MKKIILLLALITAILIVSGCGSDDALAKCLTEQGFKLYGSYWCGHCLEQKNMFGNAFEHIDYTECTVQGSDSMAEECALAGIRGYPTWVLPDGSRQEGAIPLNRLETMSGCSG